MLERVAVVFKPVTSRFAEAYTRGPEAHINPEGVVKQRAYLTKSAEELKGLLGQMVDDCFPAAYNPKERAQAALDIIIADMNSVDPVVSEQRFKVVDKYYDVLKWSCGVKGLEKFADDLIMVELPSWDNATNADWEKADKNVDKVMMSMVPALRELLDRKPLAAPPPAPVQPVQPPPTPVPPVPAPAPVPTRGNDWWAHPVVGLLGLTGLAGVSYALGRANRRSPKTRRRTLRTLSGITAGPGGIPAVPAQKATRIRKSKKGGKKSLVRGKKSLVRKRR